MSLSPPSFTSTFMAELAKVRVHVPFPPIDENGKPGFQYESRDWVLCLEIPVNLLNDHYFSLKPYKWIRYATGVVVGAHGLLSRNKNQIDGVDYNATFLDNDAGDLYYHSEGRMFPTDPHLADERITSSAATSRRAGLRDKLLERDRTCVLTTMHERVCDGVHLIAHSKGDEYIHTFTTSRSQNPQDHILSIDSPRNALLLHNSSHRGLGKDLAFLVTPNFAMDTSDLVEHAAPEVARCTVHLFPPFIKDLLGSAESGDAVRVAPSDWPPDILFDAVYASAVMEHFRAPNFKSIATSIWEHHFYPDGVMSSGQDLKKIQDKRATAQEKLGNTQQQRMERSRARQHREPDNFDLLMMVPYINVPDNRLKLFLEARDERARVAERERVEAKVNTWRQQLGN